MSVKCIAEAKELLLPALDLGSKMVLRVALCDVLDQWAVVRQKIRSYMDRLGMPDFRVF
jgi:hypothetical protein